MMIVLHPHYQHGRSLDMFVAELPDDSRLKPVRSVMYATARALAVRGVRGAVGELAKWTVTESDRGGLRKELWEPFPPLRGRVKESVGELQP